LISTVLEILYDFLSLETDVNVRSKSNKQNNFAKNKIFFVGVLKATEEKRRIRICKSVEQTCGSGSVPIFH
jgi:hypothetical protein